MEGRGDSRGGQSVVSSIRHSVAVVASVGSVVYVRLGVGCCCGAGEIRVGSTGLRFCVLPSEVALCVCTPLVSPP